MFGGGEYMKIYLQWYRIIKMLQNVYKIKCTYTWNSSLDGGHNVLCYFPGRGYVPVHFRLNCVYSCYKWYNVDIIVRLWVLLILDRVIRILWCNGKYWVYCDEYLHMLHVTDFSCIYNWQVSVFHCVYSLGMMIGSLYVGVFPVVGFVAFWLQCIFSCTVNILVIDWVILQHEILEWKVLKCLHDLYIFYSSTYHCMRETICKILECLHDLFPCLGGLKILAGFSIALLDSFNTEAKCCCGWNCLPPNHISGHRNESYWDI